MATGKKSFQLYTEWLELFEELKDEEAGQLIKHIFRYVNDQDPTTKSLLISVAFIPIKQQLKRDLKKWNALCDKNKANIGKRWNTKNTTRIPNDTKNTDKVEVKVKDKVEDKDKVKDINKKEGIVFPFDSKEFKKIWLLWKDYKKKEFKFSYKTIQSEQAALKKINDLAENETDAVEIIHESMANGWKGFFKTNKKNNGTEKFSEEAIRSRMERW